MAIRCWGVFVSVVVALPVCAEESKDRIPPAAAKTKVDFKRDIAPIFERHCNACHGKDAQEGKLRLDAKSIVMDGGISGPLFDVGKSEESLLIERVLGNGGEKRMPLDDDPLTNQQISLLRAWIDQGAKWPADYGARNVPSMKRHWAYLPPKRTSPPRVKQPHLVVSPIDRFTLAQLEKRGLTFSPQASRETLIRRLSFDLRGLPPSPAEVDRFLADESPGAYERLVERFLASPHYGERWAIPWLDLARYADSNGYQRDGRREAWAWRDWVIKAINADLPFDRFTIEQLAGDLLPNATLSQKIATGFHRGTMVNVEAGTDPEEERNLAIIDRVNTTGTVWLGTTLECAQCHNHKYDPFSQRDYYRLFAFFNSTEKEIDSNKARSRREFIGPKIMLDPPKSLLDQRSRLEARRKDLQKRIATLKRQKKLQQVKKLQRQLNEVNRQISFTKPSTLVMKERAKPRMTRILVRGDFLNPGKPVAAATPRFLHDFQPPAKRQPNRLDLAKWLVKKDNPLTARVAVNRNWMLFFGRGIVDTPEDFGTQGESPSHPQLLDWLALEFQRLGWSRKKLHRMIVLSRTYRQSSRVTKSLLAADPKNRYYSRGPRHRLSAELVRDNALAVSGLLARKFHGPPVFPYQPPGVWNHIGVASNLWTTSNFEDRNRRGLYVYLRRTVPYPSFVNFDAPSRETCVVKRSRSNTPLQALTLLNDPVFFEAAAALALRMQREPPRAADVSDRIEYGFRLATGRKPGSLEVAVLANRFAFEAARYKKDPAAARKLLNRWSHGSGNDPRAASRAAWIHVGNVLLNLDETISKN